MLKCLPILPVLLVFNRGKYLKISLVFKFALNTGTTLLICGKLCIELPFYER
jgi:hypothetical protein